MHGPEPRDGASSSATDTAPRDGHRLQAARVAISAVFLTGGAGMGMWAAHIPQIAEEIGIDKADLGIVLLVMALGGLIGLPSGAALVQRIGAARTAVASALAFAASVAVPPHAPSLVMLAASACLFGATFGCLDVAMNSTAAAVERGIGRAVMSSIHGFYSAGALLGAAAGGSLIAIGFGPAAAMGMAAAALALVAILAAPFLRLPRDLAFGGGPSRIFRLPSPRVAGIGTLVLCAFIAEYAIFDWGALLMIQGAGAAPALAAYAVAGFAGAMTVGRLTGDAVVRRLGRIATVEVSAALFSAGIAVVLLWPGTVSGFVGLTLAGLGMANTVPVLFSASTRLPGLPATATLAMVTTMGYGGGLFGPSTIGFVAEHAGIDQAFLIVLAASLIVLAGARRVMPR